MNKREEIKSLKGMLESCYTYGGIDKTSYNFERYIKKYIDILGAETFEKVYQQQAKKLSQYIVEQSTYTDSDGLTYNSLVRRGK